MRVISPQWFAYMPLFGISLPGIFSGILLGLATVLLAARSPARLAAKASPLEAASGNAHQPASFRRNADIRIFRIETALGIHHATAGKKNYILMTGAFAVCICLFLAFSTLVGFMENAMMPKAWTPELSIASETNTCSISPELFDSVSASEAVKRAYGRMFAYDVPAEAGGIAYGSNLISYEENQFRLARDSLIAGSIEDAAEKSGQVLYVANTGTDIALGDANRPLCRRRNPYRNCGRHSLRQPSCTGRRKRDLFCSEATFTDLTGETGYTIIDVQFHEGASEEDVASIEALFDGGVQFSDSLLMVQQQRNLYRAFAVLVYGFLSIITAITVFHIMNTIHMGVSAKLRPIRHHESCRHERTPACQNASGRSRNLRVKRHILGLRFGASPPLGDLFQPDHELLGNSLAPPGFSSRSYRLRHTAYDCPGRTQSCQMAVYDVDCG